MATKYKSTKGTKSKVSPITDTLVVKNYSGKKNVGKLFKLENIKSGKDDVKKLFELEKLKG